MEKGEVSFQWNLLRREWRTVVPGMVLLMPLLLAADMPGGKFAWGVAFFSALFFVSAMDLRYGLIFDRFLMVMGFVGGVRIVLGETGDLMGALMGFALGGGLFCLIRVASSGGMGGGDVKYAAILGLWLGWKLLLLTVFLAFFAGGMAAVGMLCCRRREKSVPFGPFLSLGAGISFLWGEALLAWYMGWFP